MGKVVIITGASSGIGKTTAEILNSKGYKVYNLSRRESLGIEHIKTDISNYEDVKNAISCIYEKEGRIDVLINNAGMGISGAIENTDDNTAKQLFSVNFWGMFYSTKEVIPIMRKNNSGSIINISSAAAKFPLPFQAFYSASKAAVSSFSDALRLEVKPFGINVTAILPGDVKTEFTQARIKNKSNDPIYGDRIDKSVSAMERDEENGMSPETISKIIIKIIEKKNPPPYVIGGLKYEFLVFLTRLMPYRLTLFLLGKIYG
ncbi:MAG: Cyclopentanol dehydrogenase [Firmicutes bacterium ADurb.Bin080]|jgi:short-subunit dehydrogenase|nr:SDR family NAD(P)-dependent oxidoreductase [Clostridiales bacterium]OQC12364.1 MAG: Cyclopentanol dehydrogenase [Firmicutes bacterium ADurb.Bin080]